MKFLLPLPVIAAYSNFDNTFAKHELCNLNYEACIEGDTTNGADCIHNPELGAELLCTSSCDAYFQDIGDERFENYNMFCDGFRMGAACPPGGCVSSFEIDYIKDYGCWCNFDDHLMEGAGEAVNEYDAICKDLQLCLRCAKIDGDTDGYSCNPKTHAWDVEGNGFFGLDCSSANAGDLCAESLCSCNTNFVIQLFSLQWQLVFDQTYKHSNGFQKNDCKLANLGSGEHQCCGYWPHRYPYAVDSGRECCGEHTLYSPINEQCCANGSIVKMGEIC